MADQHADSSATGEVTARASESSPASAPFARLKGAARWLVVLVFAATLVFWFAGINAASDPPYLILALDVIFVGIASCSIAAISIQGFLRSGSWPVLLLGAGALTFTAAVLVGAWALPAASPNAGVAIHNSGALLAAALHALGALLVVLGVTTRVWKAARASTVLEVYLGSCAVILFITFASLRGLLPPYFVEGVGGTPLRQLVVAAAALLFFGAGLVYLHEYTRSRVEFIYWYALGLLLTSLGMAGVLAQTATGTPLNWLGRSAQLLGGLYLLVAALVILRQARATNLAPADMLVSFFWRDEASLKLLFESIMDAIIVTDRRTVITDWNQAAEAVYGWKAAEVVGKELAEVLRPAYPSDVGRAQAQQALRDVGTWQGEVGHTHRNGQAIPVLITVSVLRDMAGRALGTVTVSRDITERKRVEDQLRRSEEQTRDLIRYAPTGICEIDCPTVRFRSVNDAMCHILGYSRDELVGMSAFAIVDDEGRAFFADRMRRTLAGEEIDPSVEYRVNKKDGSSIFCLLSIRLAYRGGQPDSAFVIAHDVTGRRRAEEVLERRVSERTADLQEAQTALRLQNERLEILHEIDRAILAARTPAEIAQAAIDRVLPATGAVRVSVILFDAALEVGEILAVAGLQSPQTPLGFRFPASTTWMIDEIQAGRVAVVPDIADLPEDDPYKAIRLAEGIHASALIPMTAGGSVIGALAIQRAEPGSLPSDLMDFAAHVADSLAVAVHNARLNEAIQESRRQLQAYSHRLVEAVEHERRAIALELHDQANQLLVSLMLGLGILEKRYTGSEEATRHIAYLCEIADELSRSMHDLAVSLRPASLDRIGLVPALRQLVEMFQGQRNLAIQLATSGISGRRLAPETETALYRIVQEALTNIVRHAGAANVGVVVQLKDGHVMAIIEDDGCGFDVETALRSGGLGLLSMQERARAMGGALTIESVPGKGTTLHVQVPQPGMAPESVAEDDGPAGRN